MFSLTARRITASTRVTITRSLHAAACPQMMLHPAARPLVARRFEHTTAPGQTLQERANFQGDWIAPVVSYERVKALTEQPNENVYLIDVREPDEVAQGAIPSAVSIPLSGFAQSIKLDEAEFKEKHGFNKPALDKEVIFYCRSGKRSASASDIARRNGYKNVLNYEGSWLDWTARQGTPGAGAS